jgi:orotidine-5'-phosphate decarboxylase
MTYNEEQRAIIARIGEISARFDAAHQHATAAQVAAGANVLNIGRALVTAMESAQELTALQKEYGDAFREFLETL